VQYVEPVGFSRRTLLHGVS